MRPNPAAAERLSELLTPADPPDRDDAGEDGPAVQWGLRPGWTPPEPAGRHREEPAGRPLWRVGWRAGLLLTLLVGVIVTFAGAWSITQRGGSVVVEPAPAGLATTVAAPTSDQKRPASAPPSPTGTGTPAGPTTPTQLVVHVVGAVNEPGIVTLAPGARVQDALDAAGGPLPEADLGRVNLARLVTDGEQIPVPLPGETLTPATDPASGPAQPPAGGGAGSTAGAATAVVNINTATAAELDTLPGIGPVLAERIVAWRTENGPFLTVDDLGEVSGIGDKVLADVRPLVAV